MRLLHVTSIASPHQLPLARSLARRLGPDGFRHVTTRPMDPERTAMGWGEAEEAPWLLRLGDRPELRAEYERWWDEADAVLCGERDLAAMAARAGRGRLTLYMSERWWKPPLGRLRLFHPRFMRLAWQMRQLASLPDFHYLAIGLFAHRDIRTLLDRTTVCRLWGYFTELPPERTIPLMRGTGVGLEILYAGRLLAWKGLDALIRAYAALQATAPLTRLTILGDGPSDSALHRLARSLDVDDGIAWLRSRPIAEVLQRMDRTHVFVLPSNGSEGWGAVLNEAMSRGCTVVASDQTGAASAMIRDGVNGLLFRSGDWRHLARQLGRLEADEMLRRRLGEAGQSAVYDDWSPDVAADRLIAFCGQDGVSAACRAGPLAPLAWNQRAAPAPG